MDPADILDIHQLIAFYAHAADREDPEMIRRCFTPNGVFDARPCEAGIYEGVDEIIRWLELGKPPMPPFHLTTNIFVYEENGEVRALSKWLVTDHDRARPMGGDYEDLIVRHDGEWRIRYRIAKPLDLDREWSSKVTF